MIIDHIDHPPVWHGCRRCETGDIFMQTFSISNIINRFEITFHDVFFFESQMPFSLMSLWIIWLKLWLTSMNFRPFNITLQSAVQLQLPPHLTVHRYFCWFFSIKSTYTQSPNTNILFIHLFMDMSGRCNAAADPLYWWIWWIGEWQFET